MTPENCPGKGEWSVKVRGLPKDYKQMSQDVKSWRGQEGTPVPGRRFLTVQRALLSTLPWLLNCSTSVANKDFLHEVTVLKYLDSLRTVL